MSEAPKVRRGDVVVQPEPGVAIVYRAVPLEEGAGEHPHEVAVVFARGISNTVSRRILCALRDSIVLQAMRRDADFIFHRAAAVRFRNQALAAALILDMC